MNNDSLIIYSSDIPNNIPQRFVAKALMEEEDLNIKPVIEEQGISFIYIRHNDLYSNYLS